jgi:OPA family glycerol-3-phosphate transporter-like MFS transporter
MYTARYNFGFANKQISDAYGWDTDKIGWIISFGSLLYGITAMFIGPIADKIGGRRAMLIGATGAFVFNALFGLGAYLGALSTINVLFAYLISMWMLNMMFQSCSALALIKINSAWFHRKERGRFSAVFGSMIQLGRAAVYAMMTMSLVVVLPWQWKFFLPAMVVSVMTIMTYLFVQNSPNDLGFGTLDTDDATSGDKDDITFGYVVKKIFANPVTIAIAAAEFCTGTVRRGFEEWFPRYMQEAQGLTLDNPIFQKGAFAIVLVGIAGAFVAGYLSDWRFESRRMPVAFIGYTFAVLGLGTVSYYAAHTNLVIVGFVCISFGISIVHSMLSGTASMDFGGKKAAATATGFFDGMQYIGGAVAGYGVGKLVKLFTWSAWAPTLIGFAAVGAILMLALWNVKPQKKGGSH